MIAVIGDIHGCLNTLKELVEKIKDEYPSIKIYSVGDLVDRGNFSYEVIEFIKSQKIEFTPGNHDYMFCYFVKQLPGRMARAWLQNGSEKTIESYSRHNDCVTKHIDFIMHAPLFINLNDCFISHAGISIKNGQIVSKYFPKDLNALETVLRDDLESSDSIIWARGELLNIGKLQIAGHTRRQNVEFKEFNNVAYIDTSVYMMNKLSAVIVEDNNILDILSVATRSLDLE
jgi:serine/threonine protein phosphatase 1